MVKTTNENDADLKKLRKDQKEKLTTVLKKATIYAKIAGCQVHMSFVPDEGVQNFKPFRYFSCSPPRFRQLFKMGKDRLTVVDDPNSTFINKISEKKTFESTLPKMESINGYCVKDMTREPNGLVVIPTTSSSSTSQVQRTYQQGDNNTQSEDDGAMTEEDE